MGTMDAAPGGDQGTQAEVAPPGLRVFISYRNAETWGAAYLRDRLADSFGAGNVFLSQHDLQPGMKWLEEIKLRRASCNVLLSLIGPQWVPIMTKRRQAANTEPAKDYVRFEIEYALKPNSEIHLIPVLMGDVRALKSEELPRSLQALAKIEAAQVRPKRLEDDVAALIRRLETIAREQSEQPEPAQKPITKPARGPEVVPAPTSGASSPDDAHFELILHQIIDRGNLVPVLGSRLTGGRGSPPDGSASLPSAEELAADLAKRFGVKFARPDLAEVAQYVYVTNGRPDLYLALREILTADREPGPVHRFLARVPRTLERLGLEKQYQLIVSTNFDTALEQAFEDEGEPYDLAVYMAEEGKFIHFPYEDNSPMQIDVPNKYLDFPIGEDFELWRTVIVKIHGGVDGYIGAYRWKGNYVITQDQYIDYLSRSPIESLVPVQVLDKLKESHCLFLGYTLRDWNLRVFLKRIWEGGRIEAQSWAVEPDPDVLERQLWKKSGVDLYAADLADYVGELEERLARRASEAGEP
jgi:hypothetical protein